MRGEGGDRERMIGWMKYECGGLIGQTYGGLLQRLRGVVSCRTSTPYKLYGNTGGALYFFVPTVGNSSSITAP